MAKKKNGRPRVDDEAVGQRLRDLHQAIEPDMTQEEFAAGIGCKPVAWSQYVAGDRELPPAVAIRLYKKYNVPLAWLYDDDPRDLPSSLRRALRHHTNGEQNGG